MRVCVLQILLENYFADPSGNSIPWQRPSGENYHSNVIKTCFPPKLKSADNVYDRELKVNYVKCQKPYTHVSTVRLLSPLTTQSIFASHSVCTTVAWGTTRWLWKFVDEVGSTVSYRNIFWVFATSRAITKADRLFNFTIFHCRMSTIQPASLTSLYHIYMLAHVLLAFLFLQLPQNDTIPHGVARHTPLGAGLLRNYSFYLHHSGFDDHNMGRLKKVKYNFKKCGRIKGKHFSWHFLENQFNKKQKEKKIFGVPWHTRS